MTVLNHYVLASILLQHRKNTYVHVILILLIDLGEIFCNLFKIQIRPLKYYTNKACHLCIQRQLLFFNFLCIFHENMSIGTTIIINLLSKFNSFIGTIKLENSKIPLIDTEGYERLNMFINEHIGHMFINEHTITGTNLTMLLSLAR